MARYIGRFMKDVLGENGHEAEICQRLIEIEASSRGRAIELAKMKLVKTSRIGPARGSRLHCGADSLWAGIAGIASAVINALAAARRSQKHSVGRSRECTRSAPGISSTSSAGIRTAIETQAEGEAAQSEDLARWFAEQSRGSASTGLDTDPLAAQRARCQTRSTCQRLERNDQRDHSAQTASIAGSTGRDAANYAAARKPLARSIPPSSSSKIPMLRTVAEQQLPQTQRYPQANMRAPWPR